MIHVRAEAVKNIRYAMAGKIFTLRTLSVIFISFLFLSCNLSSIIIDDSREFWAYNYVTDRDYRVRAELLAEGVHCNVWVEKGSGISNTQARNIANTYDGTIYGLMINAFGIENPSFNGRRFSDIMALADYFGDEDGKLCILLLDIKDGYREGVNESYVAGYFWNGNFFSPAEVPGANACDMIYIDTNPGMGGENFENVFTTLAHEMQHMINFVTRVTKISYENEYAPMDIWIDEGLSSAAEYIVSGQHSSDRISWYNTNGSGNTVNGLIDQGNNFFVWENHTTTANPYPVLDDYATVYLFFQWLRIQKDDSVYRDIISSNYSDYRAVTNAISEDWEILLRNWMAANYINDSTGVYGYKGEISITAHMAPARSTVSLYPGEGVYSPTDAGDTIPSQSGNIKYAGLDRTNADVNDNQVFDPGALLTYNINTVLDGAAETGTTTGKTASVNITPMGRSVIHAYSGPYRIGAGDILSRNGNNKNLTSSDIQNKIKGTVIAE